LPEQPAGRVGDDVEEDLVQVDFQPEQIEVQRPEDEVQDIAL
jgi:hypothetical protein